MRLQHLAVGAVALLLASPAVVAAGDGSDDELPAAATAAVDAVGDEAPAVERTTTGDDVEQRCARQESPHTVRWSGGDRWETAACLALLAHPQGADTVVLARGDAAGGWADALAGTVLADHLDAPVLLSAPDALPGSVDDALALLAPDEVVLLGGPGALSPRVADAAARHGTVRRVSGPDRAATAVAIAQEAGRPTAVFVVNGHRPADALVAGAAAARAGAALLLSGDDALPTATRDYVADVADTVTVIGGFGVVGEPAEAALRALVGTDRVARVAGADRRETAAAVARAHASDGPVHLVSGRTTNLVDAIGAGWVAARDGGAVLYTTGATIGSGTDRWLRLGGLAADAEVRIVGGEAAVAPAVVDELRVRRTEAAAGGPARQLRGVWVHLFDDSLKTREGIERFLDAATGAHLNTVVVQAARRHDGFSTTSYLPRTSDETMLADLKVLDRLVPAAHARGLQVHAWFSVMPSNHASMSNEQLPADHVNRLHGPSSADPWTTTGPLDGYDYLDPGVPGVQDHVVAMLRDVVEHHDVDAVHLDYLRYENDASGRHPVAMDRFARHGNGNLDDWRRQQTADLARRVYAEVAEVDPTVQVSMAAIAQAAGPTGGDLRAGFRGTRAYAQKYQDWTGWMDGGFMDVVMPMAYFRESNAEHAGWFDQWSRYAGHLAATSPSTVAVGVGGWLNSATQTLRQVDRALADGADGVVVYSYQGDANTRQGDLLGVLGATRFAEPAAAPVPAWKDAPAGGHLIVAAPDGRTVTVTPVDGGSARSVRADAAGNATFVHLAAGTWRVTGAGNGEQVVTITAGRTTRA